jgi:DNA-binding response OmpR family regulator
MCNEFLRGKKAFPLTKAKVLLIDDDPVILGAITEFLRHEGYSVVQAADLKSAYATLESAAPDIAVVDFDLPDGNALDFLAGLMQ